MAEAQPSRWRKQHYQGPRRQGAFQKLREGQCGQEAESRGSMVRAGAES